MSNKSTRNWIKGSARSVKFANGGEIINLSLNLDELNKLPNNKGYIQISIATKEETDQYGNTHSVYENDFKPEKQTGAKAKTNYTPKTQEEADDDLPF